MKIGDWIDMQEPTVPASFREHLGAEESASVAGFSVAAANAFAMALPPSCERNVHARNPHDSSKEEPTALSPGDKRGRGADPAPGRDARELALHEHEAAYALLAADAYLTYACVLALREVDAADQLEEVAAALTRQWAEPKRPDGDPGRSA